MKKYVMLCLIMVLLLCGCSKTAATGDPAEFEGYLDQVDAKRKENLVWSQEEQSLFPEYTQDFQDQMNEFSKEELDLLLTEREEASVTGTQAREDIEMLFRLLRTTYGGYYHFGGDEVFLPVRDNLIASVEKKDMISSEEFSQILTSVLSDYIVDGHFMIGSYYFTMDSEQFMYYVPDLYFKDLTGVDSSLVKQTIGPDGELTCCFAALSHDGSDLPDTAEISGKQKKLKWQKAGVYTDETEESRIGYRKTSVSDIPVLESRILYAKEGEEEILEQLEAMAGAGEEYRGLPVVIVDVRHNGGGNSNYARGWVEGFTGQQVQPKAAYFEKCSQPYMKTLAANPAYANVPKDDYYRMKGQWMCGSEDGYLLNNQSVVFLLMDKATGSSGEDFVRYLSTAEHVIRVGTNTAGVLQFGNVCEFFLPNSGIFLRMGSKIAFYDGLEMSEGIGVMPDLWVDAPDALDAVVRMCNYYNLKAAGN